MYTKRKHGVCQRLFGSTFGRAALGALASCYQLAHALAAFFAQRRIAGRPQLLLARFTSELAQRCVPRGAQLPFARFASQLAEPRVAAWTQLFLARLTAFLAAFLAE